MLYEILATLFPPQCAVCNAVGSGLCDRCAPEGAARVTVRLRTLRLAALGRYEASLRQAVLALKAGRRDVAGELGRRLAACVEPASVLVPVPTTRARRLQRGFDGAALLAQIAADRANACVLPSLEQIAGDAQRGRDRSARLAACGRFAWRGESLSGRRVVLLDDVATTGATLEDCAATLRAAGGIVDEAVVVAWA